MFKGIAQIGILIVLAITGIVLLNVAQPASILDASGNDYNAFGKYGYFSYDDKVDYTRTEKCREIPVDNQPFVVLRVATKPVCVWSTNDPNRGDTVACGRNIASGIYANPDAAVQKANFEQFGLDWKSYVQVIRKSTGDVVYWKKGNEIDKMSVGIVWGNNYPNPPDQVPYGFAFGLHGINDFGGDQGELCDYVYHIDFANTVAETIAPVPTLPPPSPTPICNYQINNFCDTAQGESVTACSIDCAPSTQNPLPMYPYHDPFDFANNVNHPVFAHQHPVSTVPAPNDCRTFGCPAGQSCVLNAATNQYICVTPAPVIICGNNVCEPGETGLTCPADCTLTPQPPPVTPPAPIPQPPVQPVPSIPIVSDLLSFLSNLFNSLLSILGL